MSHHRHVRVNPIACEAHGMCAELLPEMVSLDEWGYPIVDGRPLPAALAAHAKRAADACPTFALLVESRGAPAAAGLATAQTSLRAEASAEARSASDP
jgi:ferredoxin